MLTAAQPTGRTVNIALDKHDVHSVAHCPLQIPLCGGCDTEVLPW